MSRRGARLTIAVLFAVVCGAATWQYVRVERALATQSDAAARFERDARTLVTAITDLRGAQQAYVAAGQGIDFWTARAGRDIAAARARLDGLRREATSADALARVQAASATLEEFSRLDNRARGYVAADQRLLASDAIFGDGFEMTRDIAAAVDAAREAEASVRGPAARRLRAQQQWLAAGVAAIGFLFLLILALFAPGPAARPAAAEAATRMLDITPPAPPRPTARPPSSTHATASKATGSQAARPAVAAPTIDLSSAAALCMDLARVSDTAEIPALLERATRVLDATGIVLWIADPDRRELVPTVAHGYPAASLARLGTIPRDAENATAAAFREGRVHTVKGDAAGNGAIAAPLVTPGGCAGVMAVELRNAREQREEVRAVASVLAAQFATLIGGAPIAQPHAKAN